MRRWLRARFGADMQVTLTNDGPVTFWLQLRAGGGGGIAAFVEALAAIKI